LVYFACLFALFLVLGSWVFFVCVVFRFFVYFFVFFNLNLQITLESRSS